MKTYAEQAEAIDKRYPNAEHVLSDQIARDSELKALFEKQEAQKAEMNKNKPQEFAMGGTTIDYIPEEYLERDSYLKLLNGGSTEKSNLYGPVIGEGNQSGNTANGKNKKGILGVGLDFLGGLFKGNNLDDTLRVGSGLLAGAFNLANRNNVRKPERIAPTTVKPIANFRGIDRSPIQREFSHQLDSSKYSLLESGADFDTVKSGVNKLSNVYSEAYGKLEVGAQDLENKEGARVDETFNKAAYFNAQNQTQADIDFAQQKEIYNQKRADYLALIGQNLTGILSDEADKARTKELEPLYRDIGTMSGVLSGGKGIS
jgi:hypothetical protein